MAKTKNRKSSRAQRESLALARRNDRADAHRKMLAAHRERRAQVTMWEQAYDGWVAADCKGPRPIHPHEIGQHAAHTDLLSAAAELGIDLDIDHRYPLSA